MNSNGIRKYWSLFEAKETIKSKSGTLTYFKKRVLRPHQGITSNLIGKRRTRGINLNFPGFVAKVRLDANEIILAKFAPSYKR